MRAAGLFAAAALGAAGLWLWLEPSAGTGGPERARERIEELYVRYQKRFPDVPDMRPAAAWDLVQRGEAVLVDTRTPGERAVSTLPGALTPEEYAARGGELAGKRAFAYCTIGLRSGLWAQEQRKRGQDAYNIRGSILAWAHERLPIVTPHGALARRIHVYGRKWDLAPPAYESVY